MLGLLTVSLSEIKSYVVVLSFYVKMMTGKRLQVCNLRHSIKKGMLSVKGKLVLFKSRKGRVFPPPLPICYMPDIYIYIYIYIHIHTYINKKPVCICVV